MSNKTYSMYAFQDIYPIDHAKHWMLLPYTPIQNSDDSCIDYFLTAKSFINLDSIEKADFALYPLIWTESKQHLTLAQKLLKHIQPFNKKLIIYYLGDNPSPINLPNTLVLKQSLNKSTRLPNETTQPAFIPDYLKSHFQGNLNIRQKTQTPTVGFCGNALYPQTANSLLEHFKKFSQFLRYQIISRPKLDKFFQKIHLPATNKPGSRLRAQAICLTQRCKQLNSNFIIRDGHCANVPLDNEPENLKKHAQVKQEYLQNTISSDYILCPRGAGNFSIRLYETLCLGRIPIFINSDCVLPLEDHINWKDHCIWVEQEDIAQLPQKILNFHNALSNDDFIELQKKCRSFWENYLRSDSFIKHLHSLL